MSRYQFALINEFFYPIRLKYKEPEKVAMEEFVVIIVIVAAWLILNIWILPRFGVPT